MFTAFSHGFCPFFAPLYFAPLCFFSFILLLFSASCSCNFSSRCRLASRCGAALRCTYTLCLVSSLACWQKSFSYAKAVPTQGPALLRSFLCGTANPVLFCFSLEPVEATAASVLRSAALAAGGPASRLRGCVDRVFFRLSPLTYAFRRVVSVKAP